MRPKKMKLSLNKQTIANFQLSSIMGGGYTQECGGY